MSKKEWFKIKEKDLTTGGHYSITGSLAKKVGADAETYNITKSKVGNTILWDYYKSNRHNLVIQLLILCYIYIF